MGDYFRAIGGVSKIEEVNSIRYGSIQTFVKGSSDDDSVSLVETIEKFPYFIYSRLRNKTGKIMSEFYWNNRENYYVLFNTPDGVPIVQRSSLERIPVKVYIPKFLLTEFQNKRLKYLGEKELFGNDYYVIRSLQKDLSGHSIYFDWCFDRTNYLLVATIAESKPTAISWYKDYKDINGLLFNMKTEFRDGNISHKITFQEPEFNPAINDSIFYLNEKYR